MRATACDYFVLCERPAVGVVDHPTAGIVAVCPRCAELSELPLQPLTRLRDAVPA